MSSLKIKQVGRGSLKPTSDGVIFTFCMAEGTSKGIQSGKSTKLTTGNEITLPDGHIGLLALAQEVGGLDSGLVLSGGLNFIRPNEPTEVAVQIQNPTASTKVIKDSDPLCELAIISVTTIPFGG